MRRQNQNFKKKNIWRDIGNIQISTPIKKIKRNIYDNEERNHLVTYNNSDAHYYNSIPCNDSNNINLKTSNYNPLNNKLSLILPQFTTPSKNIKKESYFTPLHIKETQVDSNNKNMCIGDNEFRRRLFFTTAGNASALEQESPYNVSEESSNKKNYMNMIAFQNLPSCFQSPFIGLNAKQHNIDIKDPLIFKLDASPDIFTNPFYYHK